MKKFLIDNISIKSSDNPVSAKNLWLIHGFGESGEYFNPIFHSKLTNNFNIFAIDFPGFGESRYQEKYAGIIGSTRLTLSLINEFSRDKDNYLMSHSMGSVIGTLVCEEAGNKIRKFINIEGLVAEDNSRSSSRVTKNSDPKKFKTELEAFISILAEKDILFMRYLEKMKFCNAEALTAWAKDAKELLQGNNLGKIYQKLLCETIYLFGEKSFAKVDIKFIQDNKCPSLSLKNCGHWPMIDNPNLLYNLIFRLIN